MTGRARHSSAVCSASAARPASQSASAFAQRIIARAVMSTVDEPVRAGEDAVDLLVEPEVGAREDEVRLDVVALAGVQGLRQQVRAPTSTVSSSASSTWKRASNRFLRNCISPRAGAELARPVDHLARERRALGRSRRTSAAR